MDIYRLPRSFELGGLKIKVEIVPNLVHETDCRGKAEYRDNVIRLQCDTTGFPVQKQDVESAFWHELVHWILWTMEEDELRNNEKFVSLFSTFLHQFIKTQDGDLNVPYTERTHEAIDALEKKTEGLRRQIDDLKKGCESLQDDYLTHSHNKSLDGKE